MITGFSVITVLVSDKICQQISVSHLCSTPLGKSLNDYTWTVTCLMLLSVVTLFFSFIRFMHMVSYSRMHIRRESLCNRWYPQEWICTRKMLNTLIKTSRFSGIMVSRMLANIMYNFLKCLCHGHRFWNWANGNNNCGNFWLYWWYSATGLFFYVQAKALMPIQRLPREYIKKLWMNLSIH